MAQHRLAEFQHYGATFPPGVLEKMPNPQAESTFASAKLNWAERKEAGHESTLALYRACLQLRDENGIFQSPDREHWEVEPIGDAGTSIHWLETEYRWALIVSFREGVDFLPPDEEDDWELILDSNEARFGGTGDRRGPGAVLWRRSR